MAHAKGRKVADTGHKQPVGRPRKATAKGGKAAGTGRKQPVGRPRNAPAKAGKAAGSRRQPPQVPRENGHGGWQGEFLVAQHVAGENQWEVEEIIGRRLDLGGLYLVKWAGWEIQDATWEPENHLQNCMDLVAEFDRRPGASDDANLHPAARSPSPPPGSPLRPPSPSPPPPALPRRSPPPANVAPPPFAGPAVVVASNPPPAPFLQPRMAEADNENGGKKKRMSGARIRGIKKMRRKQQQQAQSNDN